MKNNSLDYRLYEVEPPNRSHRYWNGVALLKGMPNFQASSEGELHWLIDAAHDKPVPS